MSPRKSRLSEKSLKYDVASTPGNKINRAFITMNPVEPLKNHKSGQIFNVERKITTIKPRSRFNFSVGEEIEEVQQSSNSFKSELDMDEVKISDSSSSISGESQSRKSNDTS